MNIEDALLALSAQRTKAETAIVGYVAAAPRPALQLLDARGISVNDYVHDDLAAIVQSIRLRRDWKPPADARLQQALTARRILKSLGYWDENDHRTCVSGSRWSNSKLAKLFTALPYNGDRLAVQIDRMKSIDEQLKRLADHLAGKAAA